MCEKCVGKWDVGKVRDVCVCGCVSKRCVGKRDVDRGKRCVGVWVGGVWVKDADVCVGVSH